MPWVPRSWFLRRRIIRRGYDIQGFTGKDFTDEDVGFCKGVGMWHPGLQIVLENLRISQMRQKSYVIVPFSRIYVTPTWNFSLFLDLTNLCFLFTPAQMSSEQIDLGDCAMGDGVHATVSVEQPITVQDQSSQTTYHPRKGGKACSCCQFYGVPCRQVRATEDEATTRRNQRLFSSTKRKMSHQEQLAEDSLFLDFPSVDELQTI